MSGEQIVQLISVIVSSIIPIIGFITALVKVIKEKQWNILKSALCDFMIKAEEMEGSTGEEKKAAVLRWCEDFCRTQGITFNVDQVSSAIETLINLTKKVNAPKSETKDETMGKEFTQS